MKTSLQNSLRRFSGIAAFALLALPGAVRAVVLDDPDNPPPEECPIDELQCQCASAETVENGCVLVSLDLGRTTPRTGAEPVRLMVRTAAASPSLSTPSQLKLVLGYSFMNLGSEQTSAGAPRTVSFAQSAGRTLTFRFADGSSVGVPAPGMNGESAARLQMVDAEGWATLSAPAFYDLRPGDGSVWRFSASPAAPDFGALVRRTDPRGASATWEDMGVTVLRDAAGSIRQVATRTRLADVRTVSDTHYAVTVHSLGAEPETDPDTGLFVLPQRSPVRVLDVSRGASDRELIVGFRKGTGDKRLHRFVERNGEWTLVRPSGLVDAKELFYDADETGARRLRLVRSPEGALLRRTEMNFAAMPWGWAMTNRIEGVPGDATRTTTWSYYEDGPSRGEIREKVTPAGNRILYEYDAQNRVVRESMPLIEEETLYSYEPVDPSDPPLLCDTRPRCVVKRMQGVEIRRTYHVYGTNGVDVVERVGAQGAAYGGTNVLRTVTAHYPVTGAVTDGLVKSVRHEDGTIDNYAYDLTDGVWTETVTHVHEQAPDVVPLRTTRSVRVHDALGRLVETRTDLCTAGIEDLVPQADWTPIERMQYAYDVDGNEIRREDLAGRLWTSEWAGNCCGKVSETDWQGVTTTYAYDADGRRVSVTEFRPDPIESIVERDLLGQIVKAWTTNRESGVGTPVEQMTYDSLGRKTGNRDRFGQWTRFQYPTESRSETTRPSGATEFVEVLHDRILREGGTARPDRFYEYDVEPDGTRRLTQFFGADEKASEWEMVRIDPFGRDFERIRPFPGLYKGGYGYKTGLVHQVTYYDPSGRHRGRAVYLENRRVSPHSSTPVGEMEPVERKGSLHDPTKEQWLFFTEATGRLFQQESADGTLTDAPGIAEVPSFEPEGWDPAEVKEEGWIVWRGDVWRKTVRGMFGWYGEARVHTNSIVLSKRTGLLNGASETRRMNASGLWSVETRSVDRPGGLVVVRTELPASVCPDSVTLQRGKLNAKTNALGLTTWFGYDSLGRMSCWSNSAGRVRLFARNRQGLVSEESDSATGVTRREFDEFGNLKSEETPGGRKMTIRRDVNGREIERSGDQVPVWQEWDGEGRLASRATVRKEGFDPDVFRFSYCDSGAGLRTILFPSSNTAWHLHYDPDGSFRELLCEPTEPSIPPRHNAVHMLSDISAQCGSWDRSQFVEWGHPDYERLPDGSEPFAAVLHWMTRDGKTSEIDSYRYKTMLVRDEWGRVTNEVQNVRHRVVQEGPLPRFVAENAGRRIHYEYDGSGLVSAESIEGSSPVTYAYDELGRCSSVAVGARTFSIAYHPGTMERASVSVDGHSYVTDPGLGLLRRARLVSGTENISGESVETMDADGTVLSRCVSGWGGADLNLSFAHDRMGELVGVSGRGPDGAIRETFSYDKAGNLVSMIRNGAQKSFSVDGDGRLRRIETDEAVFVPDHDCAGGQTGIRTSSGTWIVGYEGGSLPVSWSNSTDFVNYRRGDVGRFAQRVSSLGPNGFAVTNEFFHLRGRLSLVTSNDVPIVRFYWTPEDGDGATLLAVQDETGMKFVQTDWNRNPIGWVNLDSGDCGRIDYDAWGAERGGSPIPWIGLCSQLTDRQTGCVFFRHRAYNPEDGRWTAPDPLPALVQDPRHPADYRYLNNDPVSGWDHGGLMKYHGCSEDQQQAIEDGIKTLCLETSRPCRCFSQVNVTAGNSVSIDMVSFCGDWKHSISEVGCATEDQCKKQGARASVRTRCGFFCGYGSKTFPLCAEAKQRVPYICPTAFDGRCDVGVGCVYFHERSHDTLRNTRNDEEIILKMESCLSVCKTKEKSGK